ncbi:MULTISPECIES: serine/threonine-protein kinase [unclassified Streptomyces]|uniref:serine/threonine-protein kinase n=1 Tax=unclassified Streptomyces TaxID=2593676 RepID=UPI002DD82D69|nr:serine/threonine-protein kinase [Streptomyces sp. NBC_01750]WSB04961.1 serine/threonine protein kinase [Streptomyces sp. NBC_01794]WSD30764.1 serine/threonine protein kinase [Streptomyces sp. NBC_01750]
MTGGSPLPLKAGDPEQIGPYQLIGQLGAGGMGKVYLGRSPSGHLAAVKVIHDFLADDNEFRARFQREVRLASLVNGPFTAQVLDADAQGGRLWMATQYVPGPSLNDAVTAFGPLPPRSLLALWLGLLSALQTFHSAGVIHRDLKPSNVLLAINGPRVIDFGISTHGGESRLTRTGVAVGTPGFMSPEQVAGSPVGPWSDIFALGSVLAFAASGTSPFGTGAPIALLYRILHEEPELIGLPNRVTALVRRCLTKAPEDRPTVGELLAGLAPEEEDEASRLLAHGNWLPPSVKRETLERAQMVLAWDDRRRSAGRNAPDDDQDTFILRPPSWKYASAPSVNADADGTAGQGQPAQAAEPQTEIRPIPLPGGGTPPPPDIPPHLATAWGPDPDPGDDDSALRTTTAPLPADTPPLPRALRRRWTRWF